MSYLYKIIVKILRKTALFRGDYVHKHIVKLLVKFSKLHYSEGIVEGSAVLLRLAKNRNVGQFLIVELINRKTMCLLLLLGIYNTMHSALKC